MATSGTPRGAARRGKPAIDPARRLAEHVTEAEFQEALVDTAHLEGYMVAHFGSAWTRVGYRTPTKYDAAGFTDLLLIGETRHIGTILFWEVKDERGVLSPVQKRWRDALLAGGHRWALVRPRHWLWALDQLRTGGKNHGAGPQSGGTVPGGGAAL